VPPLLDYELGVTERGINCPDFSARPRRPTNDDQLLRPFDSGDFVTADLRIATAPSPFRPPTLARIARWSFTHPRRAIGAWLLLLIAVTGIGRAAGSAYRDDFAGGNPQSEQAQTLLAKKFPADAGDRAQIVFRARGALRGADAPRIEALLASVRRLPDVTGVTNPLRPAGRAQLSRDGRTGYAVVQFDRTSDRLKSDGPNDLIRAVRAADSDSLHVVVGGAPIEKVQKPKFGTAEGIGLLAALIILLVAFGSLVAASLPIATALFGLAISFGFLDLVSHGQTVPRFAPELAALLGIGVGIDYALFIVTRYRERVADGATRVDAVATALATSGKAVLYAGGTVVVSLLGLLVVGLPYITGAAIGAIIAVLLVMSAALTLLPALLGALGPRIDRLSLHRSRHAADHDGSLAWRWSRMIQRRPKLAGVVAIVVLVVLALPLFAIRVGYGDAGNDPKSSEPRAAYDLLTKSFGAGAVGPLVLAAQLPGSAAGTVALTNLTNQISRDADVSAVVPPRTNRAGDTAVVTVIPKSAPQTQSTVDLVHSIRHLVESPAATARGVRVLVGGETAASIDSSTHLSKRLVPVILFVVILSMLLLLAGLRSPAIAAKAALMNLLSTGAAYGIIVATFQWGWLGHGLTNGRTGPIDPWIPIMLFTILFGLSMDYELFLMSRVREHWLRHGDSQAAVTDGLAATARVITAAAAIMVCVFASFVVSDIRPLRIFGLGMATAVFVDATLVRLVLVPSLMQLLGRAAWASPRWLDRVLPEPRIEGVHSVHADPARPQPGRHLPH
jgi:RND superfamily putative drug exporter